MLIIAVLSFSGLLAHSDRLLVTEDFQRIVRTAKAFQVVPMTSTVF